MVKPFTVLTLWLALTLTAVACSNGSSAAGPEPSPPAGAAELVKQAKDDLAKTKNVPLSSIRFESAREIQFSDSSLGCPKPDMSYLQVITPGWAIELSIGNERFSYSGANGSVIRCDNRIAIIWRWQSVATRWKFASLTSARKA